MSEFQEMKSWMRSQQCVAAATNWAAKTPSNSNFSNSNFTYASAEDVKKSSEDPDSQMAIAMDPHPVNYTSGSPPSCCGLCDISAANVDIYYWPEPDANTSCLSIIGESVRPVDYGATTTEVSIDSTETSTATYWGCNPKTFDYYNPMVGGNVTYTTATTTAQITAIGSLLVKVPLVNPWSSPPCLETGVPSQASQGSNRSLGVRDNHSPMQERNYTLSIPSSITRNVSSPVTTVSGNFTFTSPSVYANFHGLRATDACGGIIISSTMIAFAPGELATINGPLGLSNEGLFATKSFNFKDLPCPPQSVMEANWYKPEPGEPYRPLIALPSRVKQVTPWLSYCTEIFFTAYDPPRALGAVAALVPNVPSDPKAALVPSVTLDPAAKQTDGSKASIPVPANVPAMDQPEATTTAVPVPSKQGKSDPEPQPDDPTTQNSPSSQPPPDAVKPNSNAKGSNDPHQSSKTQQSNDPEQGNDPKQSSDQKADPKPNSDPNQADDSQGLNQNAGAVPQSDPKQNNNANPFDSLTEGQTKTINNQAVQPLSHGISIAGTTLTPGAPPITVSGTPIQLGPSALIIGASTVPLPSAGPNSITTTIAGHVITAAPNAIAVAGTTLTRGAPPITVSGTPIQLASSALIVGTSTLPLVTPAPVPITTTIAGQAITAAPNAVAIAANTLNPGAPATTIDGTTLSLNPAGQFLLNAQTIPLPSTKTPLTTTTSIANNPITAAPNLLLIAGSTLTPGSPGTTLSGTFLSLNTASELLLGSQTIPLFSSSPLPITTTIANHVITAAPHGIAIAGTTLTPGASGIMLGGTLVSLNTAGSVVIGSKTIALQSSGGSMGLEGLIMGAFGSGGPFGSFTGSAPSPTAGSTGQGIINGTSAGVQVYEGRAARLQGLFLRDGMVGSVGSVFVMAVVGYVCLINVCI